MHAPPVILVGEYIPQNFLLSRDAGGWRLSGLFDFGDVLTGWGEYDLLGPSAFMTAGSQRRVRGLLRVSAIRMRICPAAEATADGADAAASRQRPVGHICIDGWQHKARDLFELAELLWPV